MVILKTRLARRQFTKQGRRNLASLTLPAAVDHNVLVAELLLEQVEGTQLGQLIVEAEQETRHHQILEAMVPSLQQ